MCQFRKESVLPQNSGDPKTNVAFGPRNIVELAEMGALGRRNGWQEQGQRRLRQYLALLLEVIAPSQSVGVDQIAVPNLGHPDAGQSNHRQAEPSLRATPGRLKVRHYGQSSI